MKAVLCKQYGPPETLVVEEVPDLVPGKGEVVIDVKACGVNFPDTLIIENKYQFKPPLPFSPGGEVSGVISAVGEGVKGFKVGMPVFAMLGHGGFAEQVLANAKVVIPTPKGMDAHTAAAISMTYGTSYHALVDRAKIKEGETLLVLGASGGVGLAAIDIARNLGAKIIAAASTDEKLALCKEYGATETINYTTENLKARIKEITGGKGVDVIYDPVGGDYAEQALRGMAWEGRFLVIGFAAGDIPKIPLNLTLLKGCQIVGVFWGRFVTMFPKDNMKNFMQLIQWYAQGKIKPHIHATYPLEQAADALYDMLNRKVRGKVLLVP